MRRPGLVVGSLALAASLAFAGTALATDVLVQGTTDVRDAGLLDDVIIPGFQAAYPQYTLKYVAVGTGQALTNARAGQADAVLTHAPTQEADFVDAGYSYEPFGRAIFYSDYVILGPASDPAGVLRGAPHDAARAFELIAAAGEQGKADFVSRGDNSGTNTQEKIIWTLTSVGRNSTDEPGSGAKSNPSWYHKAGLGQAATVQLTSQCPFGSHACYEMTDRGTFNRLVNLKAVTNLKIVADKNASKARGGKDLLINSFHAYAVNPNKIPQARLAGALAFLTYLQSAGFQGRLASYPSSRQPAFFADARPALTISARLARRARLGQRVRVAGSVKHDLPGAAPLAGATVQLLRVSGRGGTPIATTRLDRSGRFSFAIRARWGALYRIAFRPFQDLRSATWNAGRLTIVRR
jgi:tungstate transport system substrate-binding protein